MKNANIENRLQKSLPLRRQHQTEYGSWNAMKHRCTNPKMTRYYDYGGRGITVHEKWLEENYGFSNFLLDMGCKPEPHYTLDRIDNNKGYSPENCRWATPGVQAKNRRSITKCKKISSEQHTYNGVTKTWKEWSNEFQVYSWRTTMAKKNLGLPFEEAMGLKGRKPCGRKAKG